MKWLGVVSSERRLLLGAVAASVLGAVAETAGLVAVGLLASARDPQSAKVVYVAIGVGLALALASVLRAAGDAAFARAQSQLESRLRGELLSAVAAASWERLTVVPGHEVQSALLAEAPQVSIVTVGRFRIYATAASGFVVLAAAALISPGAAVLAVVAGALVAATYRRATRRLTDAQRELAETSAEMTRASSLMISGLKSLLMSPVLGSWRGRQDALARRMRVARWDGLSIPIRARALTEVAAAVFVAAVLVFELRTAGSVAPALVVLGLMLRLVPRAQSTQTEMSNVRHGRPWVSRWTGRLASLAGDEVLPDPVGSPDVWHHVPVGGDAAAPEVILLVQSVSFRYQSALRPTLDRVDLTLRRGEWVGLVGESGGGKTTFIDCIAGLLEPQGGAVWLDGVRVDRLTQEERSRRLAVVTQDVALMGSSIDSILTWDGLRDSLIPLQEIRDAFGLESMFKFGSQDVVDELGRDTSGGMRTRLAVARAVAARPDVLVLDETTSRLDPDAESQVLGAVRVLLPSSAVLLSSHRDSTLAHVDRVVAVADGRLLPGTRSVAESLRRDA